MWANWTFVVETCWRRQPENIFCDCLCVSSGVCPATSAVVTGRLSKPPSQSRPEAPRRRRERVQTAGIATRPPHRDRVNLRQRPHPVKWTKEKWMWRRVDFSPFSEPQTEGVSRMWCESKSSGYFLSLTAIQEITSVHQRIIYEISHFKTYSEGVKYSCFPLCQTLTLSL